MTDTSIEIQNIQLKIWLSKTPGERLYQFLVDNEMMYNLFKRDNSLQKETFDKTKKEN